MRLVPLPESKLESLKPLLEEIIVQREWKSRTVDEMFETILLGYSFRNMDAYVDSLDNPRILLIFSNYPSFWRDENVCQVVMLYVGPESRGSKETNRSLSVFIENYAKIKGASVVAGSNRLGHNQNKAAKFWEKAGFKAEETLYMKKL